MSSTTNAAINHWVCTGQRSACTRNTQDMANMATVRWAGTPQPLNTAYALANITPPHNAAVGAGYFKHHDMPHRSL